jgi:HPt (histidine-containing phosphotransfer) domain-containing protein
MSSEKIFVCPPKGVPRTLVSEYLNRCRTNLPALKAALVQCEYEYARVFGHRIRGTGRAYGFPRLTEIGAVMEQAARLQSIGDLQDNVVALEAYLSRVEIVGD